MEIANNGDKSYNLEGGETETWRFCLVYFVFIFNSVCQMERSLSPLNLSRVSTWLKRNGLERGGKTWKMVRRTFYHT